MGNVPQHICNFPLETLNQTYRLGFITLALSEMFGVILRDHKRSVKETITA